MVKSVGVFYLVIVDIRIILAAEQFLRFSSAMCCLTAIPLGSVSPQTRVQWEQREWQPSESQLLLLVWKPDKQEMTDVACQLKLDWNITLPVCQKYLIYINPMIYMCGYLFFFLQTTCGGFFLMLAWSSSLKLLWMLLNMRSSPNSMTSLQM